MVKGRKRNKQMRKRPTTRQGRQPKDPGTMDALLKKAALLMAVLRWDGTKPRFVSMMDNEEMDGKYAEYPLGILFARKLITEQQHEAGLKLARLRKISGIGLRGVKISGLHEYIDNGGTVTALDDDAVVRATRQYRTSCKAMTVAARREVLDVACHNQAPLWLDSRQKNPGLWYLRDGLDTLVSYLLRGEK